MLLLILTIIASSFRHVDDADKGFGVVGSGAGFRTLGLGGNSGTRFFAQLLLLYGRTAWTSPLKRLPEVFGHASPAAIQSANSG